MQGDLYSPSLQETEVSKTKSYQIGSLFIVAFFGGIIGVTVLGIRNAKWLRLERKSILFLIAVSMVLFVCKLLVFFAIANQIIVVNDSYFNDIIRGFGVLCFVFYYFTLKKPFKEHLSVGGGTEGLFSQGILWVFLSVMIEVILIQMIV